MIEPLTIRLSLMRLGAPALLIGLVIAAGVVVTRSHAVWTFGAPLLFLALLGAVVCWALVRLEIDADGLKGVSPFGRIAIAWSDMKGAAATGQGWRRQANVLLKPEAAAARGGSGFAIGPHWSMDADDLAVLIAQCVDAQAGARPKR
jgi:hypothetical protein